MSDINSSRTARRSLILGALVLGFTPACGRQALIYDQQAARCASPKKDRDMKKESTAIHNWSDFLKKLSEKLFDQADEFDLEAFQRDPARLASHWLGFPGATAEAIATCETTLGLQLPSDYRGFLQASNGFLGLAGLPHGLCSLVGVEKIGRMRDKDTAGRLAHYLQERRRGVPLPDNFIVDPEAYARTLLIGESDGNECILLLPPTDSNAWEVWTYDPETGFECGDTFEEFMESAFQA